jgi:ATP-dependent RNA helicase DOB1
MQPFKQLQDIARRVAEISRESKLEVNVEQYVKKFQPTIMEVVYTWCKGTSFAEICKKNTQLFEGSLIRSMRRCGSFFLLLFFFLRYFFVIV